MYDLEMLAIGAFSPLVGFLGKKEVESVAKEMHLPNGIVWPIPITLAASRDAAKNLNEGEKIALKFEGKTIAVLELSEKFELDKNDVCRQVYGTESLEHPGVRAFFGQGEVFLAGKITLLERIAALEFAENKLDPAQSRELFAKKGWKRVVGFQTRNPIHRAHEYIIKCGLEMADGAFIHPLVGETKSDDIPASIRMQCYKALAENYFPKDRAIISVLPANMHYAGPREAILHALVRKNYGCTHFIVGRDHAGVGNYYGSYDAHRIFDKFTEEELGITPLFFEHSFYCKTCEDMVSAKTCPHDNSHHVTLSGTKVREMLARGEKPPMEFTRPEIADILINNVFSELSRLLKELETASFAKADVLGVQIASFGAEGTRALLETTMHARAEARKAAIHGLWAMGSADDERVLAALKKSLNDSSKEVRACGAWGIGYFANEGETQKLVHAGLLNALQDAEKTETENDAKTVMKHAITRFQ